MKYIFRLHALQRMVERKISKDEVILCIEKGRIIEQYPNDKPYSSFLNAIIHNNRPLHIVYAKTDNSIIVVYEPNPDLWESNFTKRKKK